MGRKREREADMMQKSGRLPRQAESVPKYNIHRYNTYRKDSEGALNGLKTLQGNGNGIVSGGINRF